MLLGLDLGGALWGVGGPLFLHITPKHFPREITELLEGGGLYHTSDMSTYVCLLRLSVDWTGYTSGDTITFIVSDLFICHYYYFYTRSGIDFRLNL